MAIVLAVGLALSSFFVVRLTRANLVSQVDEQLRGAMAGAERFRPGGPDGPPPHAGFSGQQLALVVYSPDGDVLFSAPSGFSDNPDPLPAVDVQTASSKTPGDVFTAPAQSGSLDYRAVALPGPDGTISVVAAPLRGVDETISSLVRNIAIIGTAVLLALLAVGWWLLRRGLRPLEDMAETAASISGGDLSQRVPETADRSEVGRLGSAFNTMLGRLEHAFDEQSAALAAKERSEAQLRQFVADASHELRTPLTTLRGYAELYRTGALDEPGELERAMSRIGSESERMAALVEDLLLLARIDQGRPLERETVELSALAADAVADASALEQERPITAVIEPGVCVTGDEDRLRQVVVNLLANVRTHTPPSSPVEVRLTRENGSGRLDVVDHGPGVDPERAGRIFDRFYRADPARSRDGGGSGLGLAIARAIVEAHGGTIAHDRTPGGGATFSVVLPCDGEG